MSNNKNFFVQHFAGPGFTIIMHDEVYALHLKNLNITGLIRYWTEGLQSDKFLFDIGLGNIDVGYRISATKTFDVAPTYDVTPRFFKFATRDRSSKNTVTFRLGDRKFLRIQNLTGVLVCLRTDSIMI
jgi:hypothetical protein